MMGGTQILSETSMNVCELKKDLEKVKERDKELDFRSSRTEDYISQLYSQKKTEQLFQKLMGLNIPRLKDSHINKIIDIMPTSVRDLKVVLQGYSLTINNEGIKKIVDIIKEFSEAK